MDFGIAGLIIDNMPDKSKAGSLKYMAPEVLSEENIEASPALDVWSLGCILFAMVCGELPFTGKTSREIVDKIKRADFSFPEAGFKLTYHCRNLISRMLALEYGARITVEQIRAHPWVEGSSPGSSPSKPPKPAVHQSFILKLNEGTRPMPGKVRRMASGKCVVEHRLNPNFRLPAIDPSHGRKLEKWKSFGNSRDLATKRPKNKRGPLLFSVIQQPAGKQETEGGNERESVPSFMQPIHHMREDRFLLNSLAQGRPRGKSQTAGRHPHNNRSSSRNGYLPFYHNAHPAVE